MPIPERSLLITDRPGAEDVLSSPTKRRDYAYLVSIGNIGEALPEGFRHASHRLRLVFDDILAEHERGPTRHDIERLISFARRIDLTRGALLVHCQWGVSRSSAAALITLAVMFGPDSYEDVAAHVRSVRPAARPNQFMLFLADQALALPGTLQALAKRHFSYEQPS